MFSHLFLFILFVLAFSLCFSISISILLLFKTLTASKRHDLAPQDPASLVPQSLSKLINKTCLSSERDTTTHLTHSLLLDVLADDPDCEPGSESALGDGEARSSHADEKGVKRKKKKRAKKKRLEENGGEEKGNLETESAGSGKGSSLSWVTPELVCFYPFTSTSSPTQRKIKQQYDQLVKCNGNKGFTLAQVGDFANCLIEARKELQHKSEVNKRKFIIKKALLFKANRSSMDRLRQEIFKLELEHKRLEEDAFVYNWLQQQLKLSPAYKQMLEITANMEVKGSPRKELIERKEIQFTDISFEELLAQEKKDGFWQKNGKPRTFTG